MKEIYFGYHCTECKTFHMYKPLCDNITCINRSVTITQQEYCSSDSKVKSERLTISPTLDIYEYCNVPLDVKPSEYLSSHLSLVLPGLPSALSVISAYATEYWLQSILVCGDMSCCRRTNGHKNLDDGIITTSSKDPGMSTTSIIVRCLPNELQGSCARHVHSTETITVKQQGNFTHEWWHIRNGFAHPISASDIFVTETTTETTFLIPSHTLALRYQCE